MNKKKILLILIGIVSTFGLISLYVMPSVIPSFPLKIQNISETRNQIEKLEQNIKTIEGTTNTINNELSDLKSKAEEAIEKNKYASEEISKIPMPDSKVDYGSMLIFLQEKVVSNNLLLEKVDFNRSQSSNSESGNNNQETEPTLDNKQNEDGNKEKMDNNSTNTNESPKEEVSTTNNEMQQDTRGPIIKIKVVGRYSNIEKLIDTLYKDLGPFNYIDTIHISRSLNTADKSVVMQDAMSTEKSMISEISIVLNNKVM